MKNLKKYPRKQLEKFSTVFMQLGLVLTLFVVFVVIEHQSKVKIAVIEGDLKVIECGKIYDFDKPIVYVKDVPKPKPKRELPKTTDLGKLKKVKDDTPNITTIITPPEKNNTPNIDLGSLPTHDEPEIIDTNDDPKNFLGVEEVPIYKGCEGLSKEENKACFIQKITKHVQRHFNSNLSEDLGLRSGKHKIYTQFVIDKSGEIIDVKVKAPHKRLEKEAQRIVDKIPLFTPGMQRKKPVKVKYTLPITFYVE